MLENNTKVETAYLTPGNFGFTTLAPNRWVKDFDGQPTTFQTLDWRSLQKIERFIDLQQKVWAGITDRELAPNNILAIIEETGGSVLIAENSSGETEGIMLTLATSDPHRMFLHMIGVDPQIRYQKDLGWNLSIMQGIIAAGREVTRIDWTYDPLRGSNARLNLEKLGATACKYTVNKYGVNYNELYKELPTDRFTVAWELDSQRTKDRLEAVRDGRYIPLDLQNISGIPILGVNGGADLPETFLAEIPGNVDELSEDEAAEWRFKLRELLTTCMETETLDSHSAGAFRATGFATGVLEGTRRSYYLMSFLG